MCGAAAQAEEWFFAWYLAESYGFPESLARVAAAGGFCPRHTERFTRDGIPSTIAFVYRHLVGSVLAQVETAERVLRSGRMPPASLLVPSGTCPACAQEASAERRLQGQLVRALSNEETRRSLPSDVALCMPHLRPLLRLRPATRLLLGGFRAKLLSGTDREVLALSWGENREYPPHPPLPPTVPPQAEENEAWSPAVRHLRDLLEASGCPACRGEERAQARYLTWLSGEILSAPSYAWEEATGLCPRHGWGFAQKGSPPAVHALAERLRQIWADHLDALDERLACSPNRGGPSFQTLRTALRNLLVLHRRGDAPLARFLRVRPCPACQAEATAAERILLLLLAALGDPSVRASYHRGPGLCPRHLSQALTLARVSEEPLVLAQGARVRLAVLAWELEEYLRKQAWTVRYEGAGPEGDAWLRAVEFLSRVHPNR